MPGPDDEASQPQPLAPEEAIPVPIPVPAEDAAPASAPTEDAVPGIPAADAAAVASAEDAAPDFFAAPDDPALADDVALTEDSALADDDASLTEVLRGGLRWSWELDFDALLAALSEPAPWNRPVRLPPAKSAQDPGADPGAASAPDRSAGPSPIADRDSAGEPAPATSGPVPATVAPGSVPAPGSPTALDADSGSPPVPDSDSPGAVDPMDAEFAEMLEAIEVGGWQPVPLAAVAGRVAESLPVGPDLAAWLATGEAGLEDGALVGIAASYRRLASWAQAGELAVIAQLAARSAAADDKIGVGEDGRPTQLTDEACAQVSLGLTMSQAAASWWSELAVTLTWRLTATGAALRAGQIDLARARLIAEATAVLDEDTAGAVEAKILPAAGDQTTGQLRAALRRAVITADPEGAERRREEAERRAKVSLYPDPDGTASLAGYSLPSIRAAAAMARISALAKAMKASGAGGGIDLLRAQVFLGLLLGTLPYIPPAEDGPPDEPHEPDDQPGESPDDDQPGEPAGDQPSEQPGWPSGDRSSECPAHPRPDGLAPDDPPASGGTPGNRFSARDQPPGPATGRDATSGQGTASSSQPGTGVSSPHRPGTESPGPAPPGTGGNRGSSRPPPRPRPGPPASDHTPPGPAPPGPAPPDPAPPDSYPGAGPPLPDDDDPGLDGLSLADDLAGAADGGDQLVGSRPPSAWPQVLPVLPPGPRAMGNLPPTGGGLLDLVVPWSTLVGDSGEPGQLTRIGPITPAQARHLADLAAADPAVSWRVILTGLDGRATAVSRVPRLRAFPRDRREFPPVPGSGDQTGADGQQASLIRRVIVTISQDHITPGNDLPVILQRTMAAAAKAAENARLQAIADTAAGGCAHALASAAYAPPPRLRDFITARDGTCRFPTCRQPVRRCDLDHSVPYQKGGKTCSCNLGGLCRFHHILKQHHLWQLVQPEPGSFAWITPTGRTYYAQPDQHAA